MVEEWRGEKGGGRGEGGRKGAGPAYKFADQAFKKVVGEGGKLVGRW